MDVTERPIAVFDSGLGGLTVVRAIREELPAEDIVYFGDTARIPYGTKSRETVIRFARENCEFLMRTRPKCIVVACNTASALAVEVLADEIPVPLIGVVQPGAVAAVDAQPAGLIAVLATEATVASNAYRDAIAAIDSRRAVIQASCPLFVPLVEEGLDSSEPIVRMVVERYLGPIKRLRPGVVVLGCTHYPILREAVSEFLGSHVVMVDSGQSTARAVKRALGTMNALSGGVQRGSLHCYVSDHPRRFQSIGSRFLGEPVCDVVGICPEDWAEVSVRPAATGVRATA